MKQFKKIFPAGGVIIGVIHLRALPGTPAYDGNLEAILEKALAEAEIYHRAGLDGLMIENMHDVPYLKREVGPEITAVMSVVAREIKREVPLPCGVQVLAGANRAALAIARASGLEFIRAEGFVFAHTADEGLIESDAGELLRYRKMIEAEKVLIFTDIKKKHSAHALTSDVDLVQTAQAAGFFGSDGLIITGTVTGSPADIEEVKAVKGATHLPVLVGSGINPENISSFLQAADALIVGSWFKKKGYWGNDVDPERVERLVTRVKAG